MSWKNFLEKAYDLTESDTKKLQSDILRLYQQSIEDINKQIQKIYSNLAGIPKNKWYNEAIKYDRLNEVLKQINSDYIQYTNKIGVNISRISKISMSNSYYYKLYAYQWMRNIKFSVLPRELIELSVFGTDTAWKAITQSIINKYGSLGNYVSKEGTLSDLLTRNRNIELNKIRNTLINGIRSGQPITKVSSEINNIIGKTIRQDGKIKLTGAKASSLRIARTENTRLMNAGSYSSSKYAESQGIKIERELVETLDTRTRGSCARADGQRRSTDEPFSKDGDLGMYPGAFGLTKNNAYCRGTVIDIVDDESSLIRRGRNPVSGENEVFSYKDFNKWAKDNNVKKNIYGEMVV